MLDAQFTDAFDKPRILVVDDIEVNRDLIGAVLSASGFIVDFAPDGEAACEAVWGRSYDLVLMDVEMPKMNGFEAAARIRAREGAVSGVTIVALTATQQPSAQDFSFISGIDEFIARPIGPRALADRVKQIVAERRSHPAAWKAVWRLPSSGSGEKISEGATRFKLTQIAHTLNDVSSLINAGASGTPELLKLVDTLCGQASKLGFEETAAMCRQYKIEVQTGHARCRDTNMLGVVNRALFAIDSYMRETKPAATLKNCA